MANATSSAMKEVYNGKQLTQNLDELDVWFYGASKHTPCMAIASTTT